MPVCPTPRVRLTPEIQLWRQGLWHHVLGPFTLGVLSAP